MARTPAFTHLGVAIKLLRTRAGLSTGELADKAVMTKAQISKYERSHQRPALDSLERIMTALGIDLFDLATVLEDVERSVELAGGEGMPSSDVERRRLQRKQAIREVSTAVERYLAQLEREIR